MLHHLLNGFTYPLRAFATLRRNRSLWGYVLIPLLINIAVGFLLYQGLLVIGMGRLEAALAVLPPELALLQTILLLVFQALVLVAVGLLLLRFGFVLGFPWYSQLSEQLEALRTGQQVAATRITPLSVLRDIGHALSFEGKKLFFFFGIGALVLLLNLIPLGGQVLATVGGLSLSATLVCLDLFDPVLSRRYLRFRQKLAVIRGTMPASIGFALICLGLISFPLINLLALPLCVAAGTLFLVDYSWQRRLPAPPEGQGRP